MHENAIYPPKFYRPFSRVYAATFGAGPSRTAIQNRDRIQGMIAAVVATGKPAHMVIDEPGTFLVAPSSTGYLLTGKGCLVLSDLPAGSVFEIGSGVTLKLPDSSMAGSTEWYDMLIGDKAGLDITICGEGTIDMNSINQPGWVGGYIQLLGSKGIGISCEVGAFARVHVKGLRLRNCFANASLITGRGNLARFGGTAIHERLQCYNFGEGPEIDVSRRAFAHSNELIFTDNLNGDLLEQVNCDFGSWVGNRVRHENGTVPPTGGGAVDAGGTLYAYLYDNIFENTPGGFDATTTNTVTGFPSRRNVYTYSEGFIVRGTNNPGCLPGDGQSDWYGYEAENCGTGIYVRGSSVFSDQNHRFHSPRIVGGSPVLVHGQAKVSIFNPYFTTTGIGLQLGRTSTFDGIPTLRVVGGEIASSGNAIARVDGTGYEGVFRPTIEIEKTNLTFSAGTGLITSAGGISDASGLVLNDAMFDSTSSRRSGVLASVKVVASAVGQTRLLKIPFNQRLIAEAISVRLVDAVSGSGSFTARVGTASGYADVGASTSLALTAVGQQKFIAISETVAPVGTGTGLDIYVDVTTASPSAYLRVEVELIGRLVGVPAVDDPANIANFRSWHRWPFNLYTDLGTTPATAVGDLIRRWGTYQGTALNFDAPADATRVTFGAQGLTGNGTGYLRQTGINLAGPYTMIYRIKTRPAAGSFYYLLVETGTGNLLIRSEQQIAGFYASGDAGLTNHGAAANTQTVLAHQVTAGSVGTVFKADGTIVNADDSNGSTHQSNPSNISILGGPSGVQAMDANGSISDLLIYDRILTTAELLRVRALLEA